MTTFHDGDRVAVDLSGPGAVIPYGFTGVVVAVLDDDDDDDATAIVECDTCTPTQAHEVSLSTMAVLP